MLRTSPRSVSLSTPQVTPASSMGRVWRASPFWLGVGIVASLASGAASVLQPQLVIGLLVLAVGLMLGLLARRARAPYATLALLLIAGYVILNRGFAGLYVPAGGLPPAVGEPA